MDLSQPLSAPRGPVMLIPVRFAYGERWSLSYAVACTTRVSDGSGLAQVRVDPAAHVFAWVGKAAELPSVDDIVGEIAETARLASLLLRDGMSARAICNTLSPWAGNGWLDLVGQRVTCRSASAGVLLAAAYAEAQLEGSALPEFAGALSEMG